MTDRRGGARPGAGRPRIDADAAILAAARTILRSEGLASLTVEDVARQAGVSPGTVYRRWPTKTALAIAAYADTIGPPEPVDTGSLRGDLDALLPDLYDFFVGEHGDLMASLISSAGANDDVRNALEEVTARRRQGLAQILDRAAARGELRPDVDTDLAMDVLVGPLWTRLLVTRRRITRPMVRRVVDFAIAAIT